jgi:predicted site-specific integrase-resolvase
MFCAGARRSQTISFMNSRKSKIRAAIYARVSTLDKSQDPKTQLRPLREYAERRGFTVVSEFVDHASGKPMTGRTIRRFAMLYAVAPPM